MKKIFVIFAIFFWSMIFPNISFNSFTTQITSKEIKYSDLYNKELRRNILQNAEFEFKFRLGDVH